MEIFKPQIISAESSASALQALEEYRLIEGIQIFDTIDSQIKELLQGRNPGVNFKKNPSTYQQYYEDYLDGRSPEDIGNWVYYPWRNTLVHILGESEFIEVRTNRNRYKITNDEQARLATKKVGIIGLSVGQTVAIAMSMERMYGEIRLADFDSIQLSNLNRIRTGLYNLEINKAVSVAREIAEIDPYLNVTIFQEGITAENLDAFIHENGTLDALVEECDGLDIKILARQKAKAAGIPVLMETNDRAMLDVERFDLEPNRPILHGLVEDLNVEILKTLKSNEDKVPYMLDMLSIDDTSVLLRASMLEIEQSITTWPQLASSVTLGGGIVADTIRRILLGENVKSGRFYFDVEESTLVKSSDRPPYTYEPIAHLSLDEMKASVAKCSIKGKTSLSEPDFNYLAHMAHQAPSGGNMQPWFWYYDHGRMFAFMNQAHASSFLDYNHLGTLLGFGAAIENVRIAASNLNLEVDVHYTFDRYAPLVAVITFNHSAQVTKDPFLDAIEARGTNRMLGDLVDVPDSAYEAISMAVQQVDGAKIAWIDDQKDALGEVLSGIERIRFMTDRGHTDFIHEMRWSAKEAIETGDGIDLRTIDLTETEKAGLMVAKDYRVVRKLRDWGLGTGLEQMMHKAVEHTDKIGFISMPAGSQLNYFNGGRAVQLAWLEATRLKLGFHPISPSTFIFNRFIHESNDEQLKPFQAEMRQLRKRFESILNTDASQGEIFLFRIFKGKDIQTRALRRELSKQVYYAG